MGISDRDARSRGVEPGRQLDDEHEDAERAQLDHMRLLAMRKRQVQRKAARHAEPGAKIPSSGGSPLSGDLRAKMEPQLGADLSHVNVHTSGESATAAEKLGARAFTTGSDVHFGAGEFAPGTKEGDRLIAHELTHAVQAQKSGIQRKAADGEHADAEGGGAEHDVSQPGDPAEQEADAVADGVAENLHGGGKKVDHAPAGKQAAPAIGAKLSGRKIFRAGKDPLKAGTKDALGAGPTTSAMHAGNAQQAGMARTPRHHVLPQQYRAWFDERGVNIDDYCVEMGQGEHSATHTMGWNEEIMTALKLVEQQLKRKLKKKEIEREARKLMTKFKIGNLPFIHYEGKDDEDGKK